MRFALVGLDVFAVRRDGIMGAALYADSQGAWLHAGGNRLGLRHRRARGPDGAVGLGPDRRSLVGRPTLHQHLCFSLRRAAVGSLRVDGTMARFPGDPRLLVLHDAGFESGERANISPSACARSPIWACAHVGHRWLDGREFVFGLLVRQLRHRMRMPGVHSAGARGERVGRYFSFGRNAGLFFKRVRADVAEHAPQSAAAGCRQGPRAELVLVGLRGPLC